MFGLRVVSTVGRLFVISFVWVLSACGGSDEAASLPAASYPDNCVIACGFSHVDPDPGLLLDAVTGGAARRNQYFSDSETGAVLRRFSGEEQIADSRRLRHVYAKSNPYNADDSRAVLADEQGRFWLHDVADTRVIKQLALIGSNAEIHWHPNDPELFYVSDYAAGSANIRGFYLYDVRDDSKTLLRDFPQYTRASTQGEGNMSADGRYIAMLGQRLSGQREIFTYDVELDRVSEPVAVSASESGDWVSISQGGGYVLSMGNHFTSVYSRELVLLYRLAQGSYGHGDSCIRSDGEEVLVYDGADYSLNGKRNINVVALATGHTDGMMQLSWQQTPHVSCRNTDKPGWALISLMGDDASLQHGANVMWLKLDGSGTVWPVAQHRSQRDGYFSESHAVSNAGGSRVMFASNWLGSSAVSSYEVLLQYGH